MRLVGNPGHRLSSTRVDGSRIAVGSGIFTKPRGSSIVPARLKGKPLLPHYRSGGTRQLGDGDARLSYSESDRWPRFIFERPRVHASRPLLASTTLGMLTITVHGFLVGGPRPSLPKKTMPVPGDIRRRRCLGAVLGFGTWHIGLPL